MDRAGLIGDIVESAFAIDEGRTWLDTEGLEPAGRIRYRDGLSLAMASFKTAQREASDDAELLLLAEYTFIMQELNLCDPEKDPQANASLTQAKESFDDAFRALEAVASASAYRGVELAQPRAARYRIKGLPKDAFHIACIAHRTRIGNTLRATGINLTEKNLLLQRSSNLSTAQKAYIAMQQGAVGTT
jgi:hypothetical protein